MSNVNEEIVRLYYEIKGYMVHQNLKYTIHKEKSSGESDIDLAIYNPKTHVKAIVEVKGWHTETFSKVYFKSSTGPRHLSRIFNFLKPEASKAARQFFHGKKYRKILVVPKVSHLQRKWIDKECKRLKIEIVEFKEVLNTIVNATLPNKDYKDSEFQQAVRLMKVYGYID